MALNISASTRYWIAGSNQALCHSRSSTIRSKTRKNLSKIIPGQFIAEYVGQVRAWFYYVHAVNVGLFGKNAFENVIVTGTLAGNDGRKMSKVIWQLH